MQWEILLGGVFLFVFYRQATGGNVRRNIMNVYLLIHFHVFFGKRRIHTYRTINTSDPHHWFYFSLINHLLINLDHHHNTPSNLLTSSYYMFLYMLFNIQVTVLMTHLFYKEYFISYYMIMVFTNIWKKHQSNVIHTKCVVLLRRGRYLHQKKKITYSSSLIIVAVSTKSGKPAKHTTERPPNKIAHCTYFKGWL